MEIRTHRSFDRAYAKLAPRRKDAVKLAVGRFMENRTDPILRDHALKGKLSGLRSFSAGWDLRVIYREENEFITVILIDVGSHNQVH